MVLLRTSSLIKIHVIIPSGNPGGSKGGGVRGGGKEKGGVDTYSFHSRYQMVLISDLFPTAIYSKRRPLSKAKGG